VVFADRIPRIQDYAAIGDCRSLALISKRGSLDWLCWPHFDSGSLFAALLSRYRGGHWSITPPEPFRSDQHYMPATNILQTHFASPSGRAVLTDLMPISSEEFKHGHLVPDQEILRELHCTDGEMLFEVEFRPRPDFARRGVEAEVRGSLGLRIACCGEIFWLRSSVPLQVDGEGNAAAQLHLRSGDIVRFSLTRAGEAPAVLPSVSEEARERIERSARWWRQWSGQSLYHGPYRSEVERSALALKLLAFAPSGAIVAAGTTSLPERLHDSLNWDYRFCWLRDSSLTMRALLGLGYVDEATSFISWLLHATRLDQPRLRVLYDLWGRSAPRERVLSHFEGYRGSCPVRLGNSARSQFQLDTYGEVVEAAALFAERAGSLDRVAQKALLRLGNYVARHWNEPDRGMWESRAAGKNHTHSRLMCWTALDRLLHLADRGLVRGVPRDRLVLERERIRRQIEERAWNARLQSYTKTLDGDQLDASLLRIAWHEFEPADSPRMRATAQAVRDRLRAGNGLLFRDRRNPQDGAFGACSYWAVEFLARGGGTVEEAHALFRQMLRFSTPVGLLSEEIDPSTGDALGNIPQAFTHVGLIGAALAIEEAEEARRSAARREPGGEPEEKAA